MRVDHLCTHFFACDGAELFHTVIDLHLSFSFHPSNSMLKDPESMGFHRSK